MQRTPTNLGETLNKACTALEGVNTSLDGGLAGIDFNDERKLGDARSRDVVLGRLVQHFSRIGLANGNLSEPDMLGRADEYLIEKFADDAGKKGGEFSTPKKVVELIVELLAPTEKMRTCDPTCGSGGMLVECAHCLERHGKNARNLSRFGQEKNLGEQLLPPASIVDWFHKDDVQRELRRLIKRLLRAARYTSDESEPLAEALVDLLKKRSVGNSSRA